MPTKTQTQTTPLEKIHEAVREQRRTVAALEKNLEEARAARVNRLADAVLKGEKPDTKPETEAITRALEEAGAVLDELQSRHRAAVVAWYADQHREAEADRATGIAEQQRLEGELGRLYSEARILEGQRLANEPRTRFRHRQDPQHRALSGTPEAMRHALEEEPTCTLSSDELERAIVDAKRVVDGRRSNPAFAHVALTGLTARYDGLTGELLAVENVTNSEPEHGVIESAPRTPGYARLTARE